MDAKPRRLILHLARIKDVNEALDAGVDLESLIIAAWGKFASVPRARAVQHEQATCRCFSSTGDL
jgi:hypothetical protein